jgi:N-glycosylase/DNA lyase
MVDRCLTSGQVFRFRELEPGRWVGVEGHRWFVITLAQVGLKSILEVETNGERSDFESLFRLDWDASAIEQELLTKGPELAPYLEALRGLRLMRPSSASETLVSFLCTPNNHIKRIGTMVGKLADYGEPFEEQPSVSPEFEGEPLRRFPGLEVVASIPESRLRELGFGYRGATINRAAAELVQRGGEDYLLELRTRPLDEVRSELIALPGVGRKLADCIALFALDRVEVAPIDTHMWHALTRLYFPEYSNLTVSDRRYMEISDFFQKKFGSLAGWAQQALFFDRVLNWRKA